MNARVDKIHLELAAYVDMTLEMTHAHTIAGGDPRLRIVAVAEWMAATRYRNPGGHLWNVKRKNAA